MTQTPETVRLGAGAGVELAVELAVGEAVVVTGVELGVEESVTVGQVPPESQQYGLIVPFFAPKSKSGRLIVAGFGLLHQAESCCAAQS